MIEEILKITRNLKNRMEADIPLINTEIDRIIKNKDTSIQKIERLLDILLDYMHMGIGDSEFQKLNNYYASINREYAKVYNKFYQALISE